MYVRLSPASQILGRSTGAYPLLMESKAGSKFLFVRASYRKTASHFSGRTLAPTVSYLISPRFPRKIGNGCPDTPRRTWILNKLGRSNHLMGSPRGCHRKRIQLWIFGQIGPLSAAIVGVRGGPCNFGRAPPVVIPVDGGSGPERAWRRMNSRWPSSLAIPPRSFSREPPIEHKKHVPAISEPPLVSRTPDISTLACPPKMSVAMQPTSLSA